MNEAFIKEHPSLEGKMTYFLEEWFVDIETIHETQIDKQKVKDIMDRLKKREDEYITKARKNKPENTKIFLYSTELISELKKEFGIK